MIIFGDIYSQTGMDAEHKGCYGYMIDSRDTDYRGRATLTSMVHYILEAAGDDADRNGFGVADLNMDNCSWVLSRMSVDFYRWPGKHERLTVRTWVNDVNRMMTVRNMTVADGNGNPLAAAVTQWAIIDLDKRTALDIRRHINYEGAVTDEPSPIGKPARIRPVAPQETTVHRVAYSDIDFNRHMNSLRYLGLMTDMLPVEFFERRELVRADINFILEARYGQLLTIGYEQDGDDALFEITDSDGHALCRAALRWKDI